MLRDPVDNVVEKSGEPDRRVESNRAASKPEPFKGITTDELKLKWEAAVAELSDIGINVMNAEHALEGALSIRCDAAPIVIGTAWCVYAINSYLLLPVLEWFLCRS